MTGEIAWASGPPNAFRPADEFREPEICTTHSKRFKHLSLDLTPDAHHPGRSGPTLCGASGDDEERANYWLRRWASDRTVSVEHLPACKLCERSAAKRRRRADNG